jgi:hypothetical protein
MEFPLRLAEQGKIGHIGGANVARDLSIPSCLVDDEPQTVLRHRPVGVEENAERVVGGISVLALHLPPLDQNSSGLISIFSDEPVGADRCFDRPFSFIRSLLDFSRTGTGSDGNGVRLSILDNSSKSIDFLFRLFLNLHLFRKAKN